MSNEIINPSSMAPVMRVFQFNLHNAGLLIVPETHITGIEAMLLPGQTNESDECMNAKVCKVLTSSGCYEVNANFRKLEKVLYRR